MTYDQLIEEFNNRFASGNPAHMNVSENSVYAALQELLLGTPVTGFGRMRLFSYPELYDEDTDTTLLAHEEFGFEPDAVFVEHLSGRFPTLTIGNNTALEKLVGLMANSLSKGENVYLQGYGVWSVAKMPAFVDGGILSPAGKYPVFFRDVSMYRRFDSFLPTMDKIIAPNPQEITGGVRQYRNHQNGNWQQPYKPSLRRPPALPSFTQADFNAAVTANVNAVVANQVNTAVAAATAPLNAQILALQQASAGNLQPLINAGLILQPERRVGNYTIKDFTVLNAIYRAGAPTYFIKKDLDFINVQLLSIRQAVQKMYQVAVAKDNDLNMTAIYRTRQDKRKEYSAKVDTSFVDFLYESVRVMNYAVDEVRFNQKFNLLSPTLVRDLDILP
jgi:hypothetical protein